MKKAMFALAVFLAAAQAGAQAPVEWVRATVVKTDAQRGKVTLDHERIASIDMEAMTMPFALKDKAMARRFKPGDKVRFTVALVDGDLVVTAIEAAK